MLSWSTSVTDIYFISTTVATMRCMSRSVKYTVGYKNAAIFCRTLHTLRSAYTMSRASVACLLSVTLLHPRHRLELFGNIFHPLTVQALGQVVF